jgi:hypothetical protein
VARRTRRRHRRRGGGAAAPVGDVGKSGSAAKAAPAASEDDEAPAKASGSLGAPGAAGAQAGPGAPAADEWSAPSPDAPAIPKKPYDFNLLTKENQDMLRRYSLEQGEKDLKEAEATLVRMNKALADVKAYVAAIPGDEISRMSYVAVMKEVRQRFPEVADLSQWVKNTSQSLPKMKGKLPSPKALMEVVQSTVKARGAEMGWQLSTGKNMGTVNTDRLLAAYMSSCPRASRSTSRAAWSSSRWKARRSASPRRWARSTRRPTRRVPRFR